MNDRIRAFAKAMGADIIAELPDVGHGALGAAQYAGYYRRRMDEINQHGKQSLSVCVDQPTIHALESISELLWPGEQVGAPQFASGLLKGMAVLLLDQLAKQIDTKTEPTKRILDVKAALQAALKDMSENHKSRQVAG